MQLIRIPILSLVTLVLTTSLFAIDKARVETRVEEVHNELGIDGEGVIVAILDRGIDYRVNDFRNEDGSTRIKYILDFIDNRDTGIVYTEAQINEALTNDTPLGHRDAVGHGTTTTGIAAGNGRNSAGVLRGMAPKATLIIVKITSDGAPAHDDQPAETGFGGLGLVMKGMDFVVEKAAELGMPVVMLPNIGSNFGPTDGTSEFTRKIDSTVGPGIPGVAFLNGPGDEGGGLNRAEGTIQPGETASLEIEKAQPGNLRFDLWYPTIGAGEVGLEFTIKTPGGTTYGPYVPVTAENARDTKLNVDGLFSYYHSGRDVDFHSSTNQRREVLVDFLSDTGTYTIEMKRPDGAPSATEFQATLNWSAYKQNPQNAFKTFLVPGNVWDGATAFNNISPTNYVLQDQWTDVNGVARTAAAIDGAINDIWAGSSIGPTFDGRLGVDIAAPGQFVIITYAPDSWWATAKFNMIQDDENGSYGLANAVSAAAPQVTGIVALMLQANPDLDQIQIRNILRNTARADEFTGDDVPNATWGYGKVDAYAAVQAALASADNVIYTEIKLANDSPELTFTSIQGLSYKIEYKNEINDPEWTELVSGLVADSTSTTYLDETFGNLTRRFYRIIQE